MSRARSVVNLHITFTISRRFNEEKLMLGNLWVVHQKNIVPWTSFFGFASKVLLSHAGLRKTLPESTKTYLSAQRPAPSPLAIVRWIKKLAPVLDRALSQAGCFIHINIVPNPLVCTHDPLGALRTSVFLFQFSRLCLFFTPFDPEPCDSVQ